MGLFDKLKSRRNEVENEIHVTDDAIVAMADGEKVDLSTVSDPVFAEKTMGDGVAFNYSGDKVVLCSPANGTLSVLFPTGHAFGIVMKEGTELIVHCGVDTVEANGDGFKKLAKKQGDEVKAGDPIVEVDLKKLGAKYDMVTMLIVSKTDRTLTFVPDGHLNKGQSVIQ